MSNSNEFEYVGFWSRVGASLLDTVIMMVIIIPLMFWFYGDSYLSSSDSILGLTDILLNYLFPFVAILIFWKYKSATPGKMAIKAIIVDADTGEKPTTKQYIIRYLGYFASSIPLFIGIMWVGWDSRKQGWHDKMANTVVIRPQDYGVEKVQFNR